MGILKLKKKIYCNIFLKDVEKVLASNKVPFGEKSCKLFIGYLHNDNKLKPLHIMLSKTSAYVNIYEGQTKWMYLLIKVMTF